VLVQQDVLELQVAVDARLVVNVRDGADELGEDALDLGGLEGALFEEVVVELVACFTSVALAKRGGRRAPGQYSRASQTSVSVTMTSYRRAMCGWVNWRWWWISRARLESSLRADLSTTRDPLLSLCVAR
jgi:hypothetical protein